MYHIEKTLTYLRVMVSNKARVEYSIAESFSLKEIIYFSGVYFVEEHNGMLLPYDIIVDE
jgi:hypothetical protein